MVYVGVKGTFSYKFYWTLIRIQDIAIIVINHIHFSFDKFVKLLSEGIPVCLFLEITECFPQSLRCHSLISPKENLQPHTQYPYLRNFIHNYKKF